MISNFTIIWIIIIIIKYYNFYSGLNSGKNFKRGDHVEIIHYINNVDYIYIRNIKLYDMYKTNIEQLKKEKSKI